MQRNENFRVVCGKCGARRVDRQIGLEATPDEFVARLVEVFREVRRVLRLDGTLWLNIGDSYASGGRDWYDGGDLINGSARGHRSRPDTPPRCKPKDLLGIPWLLAFALRQPYYAGRIADERDRIWLAAMIDAEGCIYIHRRREGQNNGQGYSRKADSFGSGLEIANTSERIVQRCMEITGRGSISRQDKDRRQPLYRWCLRTNESRDVLREVYPYLIAKQHEARLSIGVPSSGLQATAAWEALKILHGGGLTDVDFPAPASLHTPGWYLRSDVIWSKLNPMPESVTDRPTSAHEHVFLLAKSARYFYDAEAIRESAVSDHPSGNGYARLERETYRNGDGSARGQVDGWSDIGGRRNKRNVWEIATQPFTGWALGARRVPVAAGDADDDTQRIASPDCPVHGDRPAPVPTAGRGGRAAARSPRSPGSDGGPAQVPLHGFAPTDPSRAMGSDPDSSGSPRPSRSDAATPNSTESRRTDHAPATTPACTPSAQTESRIGDTSAPPVMSAPHPDTLDRSSDEDGSADPRRSGTYDRTAHRPSRQDASACTCEHYKVEQTDHFATFPPKLVEPCILAGSAPGDVVLDPFAGAGTTGVVALRHDRSFIGVELNPAYAEMARERIRSDAPLLNTPAEAAAGA